MNVDQIRAHYATVWAGDDTRPNRCHIHRTIGWCEPCAQLADKAAARPEPDLTEGDMRDRDRRALDAIEREAS